MSDYHPVVEAIKRVLDTAKIRYQVFEHEPVRTSEDAAKVRPEYSLAQGAKSLLVRIKKEGKKFFIQVVVPGDRKFDPKKLSKIIGTKDLRFAYEEEIKEVTGGVVPGGVPPFGNIFGLTVYVEKTLLDNEEIIFNAGDRRYSIAMRSTDYVNVVKPEVVEVI